MQLIKTGGLASASSESSGQTSAHVRRWQLPVFLLTNVRSLRYKTDDLTAVIQANNIHICCVTETWLESGIPNETIAIDGFTCYRKDRTDGRRAGGVACYVCDDWPAVHLQSLESPDFESIWLLLRRPVMPRQMSHILVAVIYHPPAADSGRMCNHIITNIDNVLQKHPYAGVMLLGDFNSLNDKSLRNYPLKQTVTKPTRDVTILDKIYTNIADWYSQPLILPNISTSDHQVVALYPEHVQRTFKYHSINVLVRSNNMNGRILLAHELANFDWSYLEQEINVDAKALYFNNCIKSLLDTYLPIRVARRHTADKPWITDEFRRLIRCRQYAWTNGEAARYRSLRNKVNRLAKQLRQRFYQKRIQDLRSSNPLNWWRETKKLTGQSTKCQLTPLVNGEAGGDIQTLANLISDSLLKVSSDLIPLHDDYECDITSVPSDHLIQPIEVFNKLSNINIHKPPGPDGIPNWFLRDFAFTLSDPISNIFNASIRQGVMPRCWKAAYIVPIPKQHPPKSIHDDIRPISLTPTISKVLESFVGRWMLDSIGNQFDIRQFGALKGRSTTHALIEITHTWQQALDQHNSVRTLCIDYSKAFDHVDHAIVLRKLTDLGVQPFLLKWMHSFLHGRRQCVKIGQVFSSWSTPNGGMPQGTFLGPYVFLALINDLATSVTSFKFVDDVTLSETVEANISQMQDAVNQVVIWSAANHLNINIKKTKEMLMGSIVNLPPPPLIVQDCCIERVASYKFLGVTISNNLNWEQHINSISLKASTRLHFLKLLKRSGMSSADLVHYYKSIVRPILEYACPVWQSSITANQRNQLESVQKRALYIISGSDPLANYQQLCEQFNIDTVSFRLDLLARKFFNKMCQTNDCLHRLLPSERCGETISKLRRHDALPGIICRTDRFAKSFLPFSLNNYQ